MSAQERSVGGEVVFMAVGDVGPFHEPIDEYASLALPTLATADLRFTHCDRVYSTRGVLQIHSDGHNTRRPPRMAALFAECGFDVVSLAGNKAMDWGEEALFDTVELFSEMGIQTVGVGRNLDEARRPVIVEVRGVRVGILAYSCVVRDGYAATPHSAGVAPMRVRTFYEPLEYQPGTPPRVITIPYEEDLAGMAEDIGALRPRTDVIVVSFHWGIHNVPRVLADYQHTVARAAFAAGADLIAGHHPHIPKGVEVFGDRVCFHSLSHFIWTQPEKHEAARGHIGGHRHGVKNDPDYPRLPMGPDAMKSLIAKAILGTDGVRRVSFLPVRIDTRYRPEVLLSGDPRFEAAVEHMEWLSEGLPHTFTVQGDEVVVTGETAA